MKYLKKPTNRQCYAKVGIYGGAGSGKTTLAVNFALNIANKIAFFDTEGGSDFHISTFKNKEFYVSDINRNFDYFMGFLEEAQKEKIEVVIIDSITHIWKKLQDDYLEVLNKNLRQKGWKEKTDIEFADWRKIKANWNVFTDFFLTSKMHIIVCGRESQLFEYVTNDKGKKELISNGSKMATEKELGYEPSLLINTFIDVEDDKIINKCIVQKDRTNTLQGKIFKNPKYDNFLSFFQFLNKTGEQIEIIGGVTDSFNNDVECDITDYRMAVINELKDRKIDLNVFKEHCISNGISLEDFKFLLTNIDKITKDMQSA